MGSNTTSLPTAPFFRGKKLATPTRGAQQLKSVEKANTIKGRAASGSFGGVQRFATTAAPTARFSGAATKACWSAATAGVRTARNTPQLVEPQIISAESVQIIDNYEQLVQPLLREME